MPLPFDPSVAGCVRGSSGVMVSCSFVASLPIPPAVVATLSPHVLILPLGVVAVVTGAVMSAAALHHGCLVGGGAFLRPIGTGAVAGALPIEEEQSPASASPDPSVAMAVAIANILLLQPEELVLGVGQPDAQRHTATGGRHVLLYTQTPGALRPTLVTAEHVQQGGSGQVKRTHSHVIHCEEERTHR